MADLFLEKAVNLPHDFLIHTNPSPDAVSGAATGFYSGGRGNYTKMLEIPDEWKDKKVIIEFDGAYNITDAGLNGHHIAMHPYGYTPFHVDISPYAGFGKKNRLHVVVNNTALPNSRWYSGAGIYRHVDLLVSPKMHIAPWGIFAYTNRIEKGTAYITCEVTVVNESEIKRNIILNVQIAPEGKAPAAASQKLVHALADEKQTMKLNLVVPDAILWDIDNPVLYNISAELSDGNVVIDSDSTNFGIRTISADPQNGFMLNGRTIKLKGGCVHHDNGILGAASFKDSEYRKMKAHKDHGYNSIRCAHNPPSRDMLDACDRLGLLVIDEAFDMWRMGKSDNDYHLFFEEWWKRDMEAFITRDRNHPCVVMWSTGNEIGERAGLSDGYEVAQQLAEFARKLDPTRLVTNAVCSFWSGLNDEEMEKVAEERRKLQSGGGTVQNMNTDYTNSIWGKYTEGFVNHLDVVGYNYLDNRYEEDGRTYPDRVICGMESFPMNIDILWDKVEKLSYVIGDFTWTSYDYIGEAGIGKSVFFEPDTEVDFMTRMRIRNSLYPWRLANDSDFDICGFERPQLYYRKVVWGSQETFIAVQDPSRFGKKEVVSMWGWPDRSDRWTWNGWEGKMVSVDVYSSADEVELMLNEMSIGRKPAGKENRFTSSFELTYQPGTLIAVSYIEGKEVSRSKIRTAEVPAAIRLTSEQSKLPADGQSLAYVVVEFVDTDGCRVPNAEIAVKASVEGAGSLAAFGTSKSFTEENYTVGEFTSHEGRLLAIVRSAYEPGIARLFIEAENFDSRELFITVG